MLIERFTFNIEGNCFLEELWDFNVIICVSLGQGTADDHHGTG